MKFLILSLLAALLLHPAPAQGGKSYQADRFDVLLELQPGGWMLVTETITFQFSGGPFTYVFRDIDPVETDGIDVVQVKMDDQILPTGKGAGQVELHPGSPYQVKWHFQPISDQTHTFELAYRVRGVIRKSDSGQDLLLWRAIPQEHEYSISQSEITLQYPETARLAGNPDLVLLPSQAETGLHRYILSTKDIRSNQEVMVEARFQPGDLIATPPHWQARQQELKRLELQALPVGSGVFLAVLIGGILLFRLRIPVAFSSGWKPVDYGRVSSPPGSLSPAAAAWLVSPSIPTSGALPLVTLFDLARRGAIRIEEEPGKKRRDKDYAIVSQDLQQAWLPHERELLQFLFGSGLESRNRVCLSELSRELPSYAPKFACVISMELESAHLLDPERRESRQRILKFGVRGVYLGIGVGVVSGIALGLASHFEFWPAYLPAVVGLAAGIGLFVVGIAVSFVLPSYSIWTETGNHLADQWRGFESYLLDITKGKAPAVDSYLFELGLPYAFGFGIGTSWVKAFRKKGQVQTPAWFQTAGTAIQDQMSAMTSLMTAADAYAGDSDGGGDGAGSGGGASGAG